MEKQILTEEFKRMQKLAGIQLNENSFEKEKYKYLKITPEEFKIGDLFLMAPEDGGEFFNHKDSVFIVFCLYVVAQCIGGFIALYWHKNSKNIS